MPHEFCIMARSSTASLGITVLPLTLASDSIESMSLQRSAVGSFGWRDAGHTSHREPWNVKLLRNGSQRIGSSSAAVQTLYMYMRRCLEKAALRLRYARQIRSSSCALLRLDLCPRTRSVDVSHEHRSSQPPRPGEGRHPSFGLVVPLSLYLLRDRRVRRRRGTYLFSLWCL